MTETTNTIVPNVSTVEEVKDFKFRFKKDKLGNQRPTVELKLPVPNAQGVVAILTAGGKQLELLMDVIADTVRSAAASFVGDDEKISQETFPLDKITWEAIANAPRAERKTIDDAIWEGFTADYIAVMPGVTGKSQEAVTNATLVYAKKFANVKTNKDVIQKLKDQLGLYMEHSKNAEQFTEVLELLLGKAEAYLKANDVEQLISNL
jgi:hypothetical protein